MKRFFIAVATAATSLLPVPVFAHGHGSLFWGDIRGLLDQQPALARFIAEHLDIADVGDAPMITRNESVKLNGLRIAPYEFNVKPKGSTGDFTLVLVLEAETTYVDASGRKVPLQRAEHVRERVMSIRFRPRTAHD